MSQNYQNYGDSALNRRRIRAAKRKTNKVHCHRNRKRGSMLSGQTTVKESELEDHYKAVDSIADRIQAFRELLLLMPRGLSTTPG